MKKVIKVGIIIIIIIVLIILLINFYVKNSTKNQIIEKGDYSTLKNIDCIIILGAGIWGDKPSPMLEDRLKEGILLYNNEVSDKIIMSGDHGREEYDEVNTMKNMQLKMVYHQKIFLWTMQVFRHMKVFTEQKKYLMQKK